MGKVDKKQKFYYSHFFQYYILGDITKMSLQTCQTNIPYLTHYELTVSIFQPTFGKTIYVILCIKFLKILPLFMVSIQEQFVIKSRLWCPEYSMQQV